MLVLISNVVHLVGIFAALVQYNMAGRLLEFILAHGPLELSVILVAAACGLAIGDALLRPGHLRRSAKLQQNAQAAITVVFFSALCLIPAGLVEAYLSPQPALPWVFKLLVGLLLALPYWSFLLKGRLAIWAPPQRRN